MSWWVVYCKVREEERAKLALEAQGFEAYLPQFKQEVIQRGSRRVMHTPLFPRYLFIKETTQLLAYQHRLRSTRGVARLIKVQEKVSAVSDVVVALLQQAEIASATTTQSFFSPNDRVRIQSGPFKDIEGIFQQDDGDLRAALLINLLSKDTPLLIRKSQIRKI